MEYLKKTELNKYLVEFDRFMRMLKKQLGSTYDFEYWLVGSARRNLVLKGNEGYDFDYHLSFTKLPKDINAKKLKLRIKSKLDAIVSNYGFEDCEDSTNVLTIKKLKKGKEIYAYDIAIIKLGNTNEILRNEKKNKGVGPYHFVQLKNIKGFDKKYIKVRKPDMWNDLRIEYKRLKSKEVYKKKDDRTLSFSLLNSAVNTILQRYKIKI